MLLNKLYFKVERVIVEKGHREIKRIAKPMMGFKSFHAVQATLAGIELHRMLEKAGMNVLTT